MDLIDCGTSYVIINIANWHTGQTRRRAWVMPYEEEELRNEFYEYVPADCVASHGQKSRLIETSQR